MSDLLCLDDVALRLNKSRWCVENAIKSEGLKPAGQLLSGIAAFKLTDVGDCLKKFDSKRRLHLLLHLIDIQEGDPTLINALVELHNSIRCAQQRVDRLTEEDHHEYVDAVCAEEASLADAMVGSAFVLAQTYLTGFVSSVMSMTVRVNSCQHTIFPTSKSEVRRTPLNHVFGNGYTLADAIHEFANYFKHRDEWPSRWSSTTWGDKQKQRTVQVIKAFGASEGCSGNLQTGLENMGYHDYSIVRMGRDLEQWCRDFHAHLRKTLEQAGLL